MNPALLLTFACSESSFLDSAARPETAQQAVLDSIQYRLEWDAENVDRNADGSLQFRNDLGYDIALVQGFLVSYSMRLYPCDTASNGVLSWLIPVAIAGHSDMNTESNWASPWVEDLLALQPLVRSPVFLDSVLYCEGIYTIARADLSTDNQPDDPQMTNWSILLQGNYSKEGLSGPFEFRSAIPAEAYWPLVTSGEGRHGVLTVQRVLSSIFNGIDFAVDGPERSARGVLLNLTEHAKLKLNLNPSLSQ